VDLVHHDAGQALEDAGGVLVAQQQRQGFGGGEKDVRRLRALAAAGGLGGVAGAVLDADRKAQLLDGEEEVAADVGRERLEGRDVEGVEAGAGVLAEVRRGWAGSPPWSCPRRWGR
jgi:hypothetical protein